MTEEEKFIERLYDEAEEQVKEVYKEQKSVRDDLLKEIAMIMLTYNILDGLMSMTKAEKNKSYKGLSKIITAGYNGVSKKQVDVINKVLNSTVNKTFNFYSYNSKQKDVKDIVDSNFKGKHFSKRVWENEESVARRVHSQIKSFIDGKINVNQIKKDIEKTYNTSAYNAKRLVTTEVAKCQNDAFIKFCKETGVEKVKRNETLDNRICDRCREIHGKIYNLEDAPGVMHPMCRGFNTIADEDNYKKHVSKYENNGIINNKNWLSANFSTQKRFENHLKHLVEYDNITPEEYLNIARELLAADLSDDIEGFISTQGWLFKYRKSTNDFAMGHPKGTISTLFKPDIKYEYWIEQIKQFKKEGK